MKAFHGNGKIKDYLLIQLKRHYEADEIAKGIYWENGKGCAVGCTVHSNQHADYEKLLGIPRILAKLEDGIFEALPNELAKEWPIKFIQAIKVGADLSDVWPKFALFLLSDPDYGVIKYAKSKMSKNIIQLVSEAYKNYKSISRDEWIEIHNTASSSSIDYPCIIDYCAESTAICCAYVPCYYEDYSAASAEYAAAHAAETYYHGHDIALGQGKILNRLYLQDENYLYNKEARIKCRIAQSEKLLELLAEAICPILSGGNMSHPMTKEEFKKILNDMGDDDDYVVTFGITNKMFTKKDPRFKICEKCHKQDKEYTYEILEEFFPGSPRGLGDLISKMKCSNNHYWTFKHENTGEIWKK